MKWYWWVIIAIVVIAIIWYFAVYRKNSKTPQGTLDPSVKRKLEDECETLFNTQAEVDKCVTEKLKAYQ